MTTEAKVIADSISEDGIRLTTIQLQFHRFILPEFNTHRKFCLSGDSELEFGLPAGTKESVHRVHRMTLRDFVRKWHDGVKVHKTPRFDSTYAGKVSPAQVYTAAELSKVTGQKTASNIRLACRSGACKSLNQSKTRAEDFRVLGSDYIAYRESIGSRTFSIRDRLKRMRIRQLNERTGLVQYSNVLDCCSSGEKEVVRVSCGEYSVTGTVDHMVLTTDGWKRIGDLAVREDSLIVKKFGVLESERRDPMRLKKVDGKWRSTWQNMVRGGVIDRQCGKCADCLGEADTLELHHVQPVHLATDGTFSEDNVVALCASCHKRRHSTQGWQVSQYLYGASVSVDSIAVVGVEETFDLEIAGEFANFFANGIVVHNSRNASSSRAVPVAKMIEQVRTDPAMPIHWGRNIAGMQAREELAPEDISYAKGLWYKAAENAAAVAETMLRIGLHKQVANRILEPFQHIHVVVSSTEWRNFFGLRCHPDAQPEMQALACAMREALNRSAPVLRKEGEWHLPYVTDEERARYPIESLRDMSAARCCRVSYLKHDGGQPNIQDDLLLCDKLKMSRPIHASPFEHVASPSPNGDAELWGNFDGWMQYRKIIERGLR